MIGRAFPGVIEDCGDALSGALMNAGPIIHPPLIIMNAAPLEHFERWDIHKEGTQPAMRRVTDALDAERIAVREALGYGAPHFPLADHYAREGEEWMYGRGSHDKLTDSGDWREHIVLTQHRYMLEDVRIGLSFLVSVGELAGVPTPLARAFLAIGSARSAARISCGPAARSRASASATSTRPALQGAACRGLAMSDAHAIACLGAGRMGRGIAVVFAYAGHDVALVDFKARDDGGFRASSPSDALGEVRSDAGHARRLRPVRRRRGRDDRGARVGRAGRRRAGARCRRPPSSSKACRRCSTSSARRWRAPRSSPGPQPIIASTTSTILVDDLSGAVEHPERFLNAHWLNPAFLVPLVELSPGAHTDPAVTARLKTLLEGIGKVPVVCAARPGYIVPRIQALAMNEAARMVEEGVASAEDIDKAIKYGFGIRFADARHAGVHRLGRRRHPLLRQPLSHRRARQRALRRAGDRRAQHGGRPHRPARRARASSTTRGSTSRPIARRRGFEALLDSTDLLPVL